MQMLRTPNSCSKSYTLFNQLSIYGAVSPWCEQFGLTEEPKVQEKKKKESVTKGVLTSVKS